MAEQKGAQGTGPEGPEADRDVITGFPVKRFLGRILLGNIMFFGGGFVLTVMAEAPSLFGYSDNLGDFFVEVGNFSEDLIDEVFDTADDLVGALFSVFRFGIFDEDWHSALFFLVFILSPGTLIGVGWYLVGRWHESVLLKKRRQALAAQDSPANSANHPLQ